MEGNNTYLDPPEVRCAALPLPLGRADRWIDHRRRMSARGARRRRRPRASPSTRATGTLLQGMSLMVRDTHAACSAGRPAPRTSQATRRSRPSTTTSARTFSTTRSKASIPASLLVSWKSLLSSLSTADLFAIVQMDRPAVVCSPARPIRAGPC
jgi:hypothetical protein